MRSVFQIYAAAKDALDGRSATLCLPATPYEMLDVLDRARVKDVGELYVQIEEYHRFPQLAPFLNGELNLCELNALAQKLSELDERQSASFEGLVNMEIEKREPIGIPRLIDLAYSTEDFSVLGATHTIGTLDEYLFTPQYASPEDMARDYLASSMGSGAVETLLPHVNLHAYGQALIQEQECALTEYGLMPRYPRFCRTQCRKNTI